MTWRAVHVEDGTDHAIKVVFNRDPALQERIRRAAEAQQRLNHPNLVRVDEVLEVDGAPAVVMEFVRGGDLETWLAERRPIGQVLAVWRDVARGVGAAHAEGLVHRNLKPAKVLLEVDGAHVAAKVNDFTLVKIADSGKQLTQMGVSFGTPQYMAPEQFRDVSAVDARADLFALGAILYEMVTGKRAYEGSGVIDIYKQVAAKQYRPPQELVPDVPDAVVATIERLLEPDPTKRPADVTEALELLFDSSEVEELVAPYEAAPPAPAVDDGEDFEALANEAPPPKQVPIGLLVAVGAAVFVALVAAVWSVAT